jgi:hypothetical protein
MTTSKNRTKNPMLNKVSLYRGAMAALLAAAALPAHAQTDPNLANKLLIAILVKKGVLSQSDASSIMQQVQTEAAAAQAAAAQADAAQGAVAQTSAIPAPAAAPVSSVTVSSTRTADGTIHVTYIPQVVRDQIASAVTGQVIRQQQAQGYAGSPLVPDWVNRVHISGDFRFRYESDLFPRGNDDSGAFPNFNAINTGAPYDVSQGNVNFPPQLNVDQNRNRFRLRARLGVDADLGEGFALGLRIATGENDSPVSENQTLGGAPSGGQGGNFSKYAIWLDRAYLSYKPQLGDHLNLKLQAGRFDNPFFSTNLLWADDLGFDGVAAMASYQAADGLTPFITGGAFPVYNTDFSFASNQPAKYPSHNKWLFGLQGGTAWKINNDYSAKFGVADYLFTNVAGKLSAPCFVLSAADQCSTDNDRPSFAQNGNTYMALRNIVPTTANGNGTTLQYQYFGLASGFDELTLTGEFDIANFDPTHIWLNGEYVRNLAFTKSDIANKAVNNRGSVSASGATGAFEGGNTGYFVYGSIGHKVLAQRWDWNATLGYKYVQSDAVIDGLDDSDFGLGGTNLKGYTAGGNVALSQQVWVRLRYLSADSIAGPPYKADVLQLDLNAKF